MTRPAPNLQISPYYQDDAVTIYHGEAMAVLAALGDVRADVLLTDPPYSSGGMFRSDRAGDPTEKYRGWSHSPTETRKPTAEYGTFAGDNRDQWAWLRWVSAWSLDCLRAVRPGGHAFLFSDWRQLPAATDALQFGGWVWQGLLVWNKGVGRPTKGRFRNHLEYVVWGSHGQPESTEDYPSTLITVPTVNHRERRHVTEKPVEVVRELFRVVPSPNALVLDPFMGSGTTLRAAKDLGHRAIGIEIEERYCEIAAKRCAQEVLELGVA